jgi:hypothetical protein
MRTKDRINRDMNCQLNAAAGTRERERQGTERDHSLLPRVHPLHQRTPAGRPRKNERTASSIDPSILVVVVDDDSIDPAIYSSSRQTYALFQQLLLASWIYTVYVLLSSRSSEPKVLYWFHLGSCICFIWARKKKRSKISSCE